MPVGGHPSGMLVALCMLIACADGGGTEAPSAVSAPAPAEFVNPQRVTIRDWDDHVMEPSLSRDGRYLFFNNSNDPSVNTDLHWAERVDDLTFQYRGEIGGANTPALEGVASMDRNSVFYFVSTRSYDQTASTIYRGNFAAGSLTGIELVPGVSAQVPGRVNFDAEISPDGDTLWFVDSQFGPNGPQTADVVMAERNGQGFLRVSDASVLGQINTVALEYAPAVSSSGLEIFFTRLEGNSPVIFTAWRSSFSEPFGVPRRIAATAGFVEAPSLSADEKSLYYHKREGDRFVLYRLSRP